MIILSQIPFLNMNTRNTAVVHLIDYDTHTRHRTLRVVGYHSLKLYNLYSHIQYRRSTSMNNRVLCRYCKDNVYQGCHRMAYKTKPLYWNTYGIDDS